MHLETSWRHFGPSWRIRWPPRSVLEAILGIWDALESARDVSWRRQSLGKKGWCMRLGASGGRGGAPSKTTETLPDSTWHSSTPQRARRHGGGYSGIVFPPRCKLHILSGRPRSLVGKTILSVPAVPGHERVAGP
eukprot:2937202-Pyramimonas_sp.AAC.1